MELEEVLKKCNPQNNVTAIVEQTTKSKQNDVEKTTSIKYMFDIKVGSNQQKVIDELLRNMK